MTGQAVVYPRAPVGTGVLLVAGSSGRVDSARADLLAQHGAVVLPLRWFGGPGQQPGPFEVPLELFMEALDRLARECDHLAVVGTSFGAEAMLLTAAFDTRVTATVAFAPSSVVWPGWNGTRWTSHWTLGGSPLPYVPFLEDRWPTQDPPSFRELYAASRAAYADDAAVIPVDRIRGSLVLVAGGNDQVWPAADFAAEIASRRGAPNTVVVTHPEAGHRTVLPGEPVVSAGAPLRRGGTPQADAALGTQAWPSITTALRLHEDDRT